MPATSPGIRLLFWEGRLRAISRYLGITPNATWLSVAFLFSFHAGAATFDGTLIDAVSLTLQHQPSIVVSKQQINASEGQVLVAKSAFDTTLTAGAGRQRSITPLVTALQSPGLTEINAFTNSYQLGIAQKQRTGLTINPALTVIRTLDNQYNASGPSLSNVAVNFTLPVLKGGGTIVNTAPETSAQLNLDAARYAYRQAVSAAVFKTVAAYWDYLASIRILDVSLEAEARANTLLNNARKLAKADEIPEADVLKYEANLARDTAARSVAEQARVEARAALDLAMGLSGTAVTVAQTPLIDDFPAVGSTGLSLLADPGRLDDQALRQRPDMVAAEYELRAAEILLVAARADDRSRLDLTASIGYNGMVEGGPAIDPVSALRFREGPNASLGLNYTFPVSNYENRGQILQRSAAAEQARAGRDALANTVRANVEARFKNLHATALQLQQAEFQVRTQTKVYANENKKYQLGVATVLDLLTSQSQLTSDQIAEVSARRNFAQEVIRFRFETGTLLDEQNVQTLDKARLTTLPVRGIGHNKQQQ